MKPEIYYIGDLVRISETAFRGSSEPLDVLARGVIGVIEGIYRIDDIDESLTVYICYPLGLGGAYKVRPCGYELTLVMREHWAVGDA